MDLKSIVRMSIYIYSTLRNVTESLQYVTDEINGHSQASCQVPNPPGYIWGQKLNFAYIVEPCAVLLHHLPGV